MRTSTRQTYSGADASHIYSFVYDYWLGPSLLTSHESYIWRECRQETGFEAIREPSEGVSSRDRMKDFQHYKRWYEIPSGLTMLLVGFGKLYYRQDEYERFFIPSALSDWSTSWADPYRGVYSPWRAFPEWYNSHQDEDIVSPPDGLDELWAHGLKAMMPELRSQLSAVNSLIELKDFVSIPQSIREAASLLRTLNGLRKGKLSSLSNLGRLPLREIVRQTAGNFLQWKFNLAPLLSDIAGVYRAVQGSEKRINALISRCNKVQTCHWKATVSADALDQTKVFYSTGACQGSVRNLDDTPVYETRPSAHCVTEPSTFHMTIEYTFTYTQYQLEHARLLSLLDELGVTLNPQIIWNAIPWSFVVDWLLKVGQYLEQFETKNMEPKINIRDGCWSIRRSRYVDAELVCTNPAAYGSHWKASGLMPRVFETAYRRERRTMTMSSILTSGLSSSEFVLGAALMLSRRRRRTS